MNRRAKVRLATTFLTLLAAAIYFGTYYVLAKRYLDSASNDPCFDCQAYTSVESVQQLCCDPQSDLPDAPCQSFKSYQECQDIRQPHEDEAEQTIQ